MLNDLTDDELITLYVNDNSEHVFRQLVDRHHDRLFARFMVELKNRADATDLEQQLWLQVFRNLQNYKHEGKFSHYLSTIASNLLNDFWRGSNRRSDVFVESRQAGNHEGDDDAGRIEYSSHSAQGPDPEQSLVNEDLVDYLVTVLVPQLPVEQRTAWLLRHESEYWEPGQRLDWQHLAQLNGTDQHKTWSCYEVARDKLMKSAHSGSSGNSHRLSEDEQLVFLVWSQAQRLYKEQQFTWDYFADLLDVPVNTMKTRYRAAQKALSDGLTARMEN